MINIFHAAGHTVEIDTLRIIDLSMANDILRRYEQNGYIYIPTEISPYTAGRIILASFDIIDVLEETIDGKNTFHATQCVLWQRRPPSSLEKTKEEEYLIRKYFENTIDIAPVYTGARPNPIITCRVEPEIWDMGNGCQAISNLSNKLGYWLVSTTKMNKIFHPGQLFMQHVVFLKQQLLE